MSTKIGEPTRLWFTSDLHFGHKNIIQYCDRPYASVEEMDEAMIRNWNAAVMPDDVVYVLGDFSFHKTARSIEIFKRLHGTKILVRGNHDKDGDVLKIFAGVHEMHELNVADLDAPNGEQRIVLCHYAMRVWNKSHRGSWQLHGHSHGTLPVDPTLLQLDVGVDPHGAPISYARVKQIMSGKQWKPSDHHGMRD